MNENSTVRTVNGRYVSYRYYGDTSSTYNHGGIVVIATHHDKEQHKVFGGLCIIPNHVTVRTKLPHGVKLGSTEATTIAHAVPHKYEQKAARAIADARLHFAMFGEWSSELDNEISKHAKWSPTSRFLTAEEIDTKIEALRSVIPPDVEGGVAGKLASYRRKLEGQSTFDVATPECLHREESAFEFEYNPEDYDTDLTSEDIDLLVEEAVDELKDAGKIPAWAGNLGSSVNNDNIDYDETSLRVVNTNTLEEPKFAIVRVNCLDGNVVETETMTDEFDSLDELDEYVSDLGSAMEDGLNNDVPLIEDLDDVLAEEANGGKWENDVEAPEDDEDGDEDVEPDSDEDGDVERDPDEEHAR